LPAPSTHASALNIIVNLLLLCNVISKDVSGISTNEVDIVETNVVLYTAARALLLFYDHDKAGLKITRAFRKNLRDCERGTGWSPEGLIIERFGLNKDDIEKYGLMWIENVRTGSGRTLSDYDPYVLKYGRRKCESNALFKNDETLEAAEQICRRAIEKYYGEDALERFRKKEKTSKKKLKDVYDNPVWQNVKEKLEELIEQLGSEKEDEEPREIKVEKETLVFVDNEYYGNCPKCQTQFNYTERDYDKQVRCRYCKLLMRLKFKQPKKG